MSIQKRTIYFDGGSVVRFWDWAMVTTTIGAMFEPFVVNARRVPTLTDIVFDPTDEINRIDYIEERSIDKEKLTLGDYVHGGYQLSREGR
jgi:hypothetical protein